MAPGCSRPARRLRRTSSDSGSEGVAPPSAGFSPTRNLLIFPQSILPAILPSSSLACPVLQHYNKGGKCRASIERGMVSLPHRSFTPRPSHTTSLSHHVFLAPSCTTPLPHHAHENNMNNTAQPQPASVSRSKTNAQKGSSTGFSAPSMYRVTTKSDHVLDELNEISLTTKRKAELRYEKAARRSSRVRHLERKQQQRTPRGSACVGGALLLSESDPCVRKF
ncbi:hypothetical protein O3P69_013427 [Scylla paramamosain]|uniref:Uncharacterized protein n=1 Tax=Scylla paramamosain TaxID=85552 RepID=A0AAW0U063_SCYPA